ncbi:MULTISPECIES: hypothetical protein [Actinoalloteichus]|uniref:hypothetical protein n=1 Tax=Actinoalloteichus TaxID=65496 RepID=UPI0012FC1321|nr:MULTISPECIES: hypothetical protein [Actinoalloteichus]
MPLEDLEEERRRQHRLPDRQQDRSPAPGVCTIISFVLAAIAPLFCPILFGPAAFILAIVGYAKATDPSPSAIPVAIAATIAGFALGALVFHAIA